MAASSSIQESGSFDYRSFWMLAVAVITPINSIAARSLLITLTPIQLIVIRSSSIAACILLWAIFRRRPLATPCAGHQILRAFIGVLAMCCWVWSLNRQPLANATALFYTSPIFLALGALWRTLKRKHDLPWGSLGSILLGFIGIVLILSPCIHNFNQQNLLPMLVSLFGGFCASQAILKIRHMRKSKEPAWRTAMYFSAISAFGAAFLIDFDDLFSVLRANDASLPYAMLIDVGAVFLYGFYGEAYASGLFLIFVLIRDFCIIRAVVLRRASVPFRNYRHLRHHARRHRRLLSNQNSQHKLKQRFAQIHR